MTDFDTVRIDYLMGRLTQQQVTQLLPPEALAALRIRRSPLLGARGAMRDAGLDVTTVDDWRLK